MLAVEALVPEATVEALHKPVFPRTGRGNIDRLDVLVRQPALEIVGDELRAVVGPDVLWGAILGDGRLHQRDDVG